MTDNTPSYRLPTEKMPTLSVSHHLSDLLEVREFLESRGIGTSGTRIERYCRFLEQSLRDGVGSVEAEKIFKNSVGEPFKSPVDWYLYVLREVHELMWILKGLKSHVPVGVDAKLRTIVGGRDFAALDKKSHSRNTQFELRIASYFCQGGCEVDVSTDTDVIARAARFAFFVECKRVASRNALGARLSDARGQLGRRVPRKDGKRRTLGCVAVDVTKVAFPHNGLTLGLTDEHSRDVIQKKLVAIADDASRSLSFESCPALLCYWLQVHIAAAILYPSPVTPATRFSSCHIRRPSPGCRNSRALTAFYGLIESVSTHDSRASVDPTQTPRETLSFPAGTTFGLDYDRVLELLEQGAASEDELEEEVGTLNLEGVEHKFTFFEVCSLPDRLVDEFRRELSVDKAKACLQLLAEMYLRRYPYEQSEQSTELGNLAGSNGKEE
ncbi:MAG: hypothetical protein ABIK85_09775 [Candidatus Eisenbacteria bacterium]